MNRNVALKASKQWPAGSAAKNNETIGFSVVSETLIRRKYITQTIYCWALECKTHYNHKPILAFEPANHESQKHTFISISALTIIRSDRRQPFILLCHSIACYTK